MDHRSQLISSQSFPLGLPRWKNEQCHVNDSSCRNERRSRVRSRLQARAVSSSRAVRFNNTTLSEG